MIRFSVMTEQETAEFRADLKEETACPACGHQAARVDEWDAATRYLHQGTVQGRVWTFRTCWVLTAGVA